MADDLKLTVKGKTVPVNAFVKNILNDVLIAILKNLRNVDIDTISEVEIS
ncbi:MAG: hypothetical protein GF411_13695 [Candidatus Lokiarchaeota archaeon]|nr:hypothetical protein [Candidatus Lokiarchaeota archaeon]